MWVAALLLFYDGAMRGTLLLMVVAFLASFLEDTEYIFKLYNALVQIL